MWICSSISSTATLAPPCSGPQSAPTAAAHEAKRLAWLEPDHADRRGAAVLLVVGVQEQDQVQGVDHLGAGDVLLVGHREHHVQELAT